MAKNELLESTSFFPPIDARAMMGICRDEVVAGCWPPTRRYVIPSGTCKRLAFNDRESSIASTRKSGGELVQGLCGLEALHKFMFFSDLQKDSRVFGPTDSAPSVTPPTEYRDSIKDDNLRLTTENEALRTRVAQERRENEHLKRQYMETLVSLEQRIKELLVRLEKSESACSNACAELTGVSESRLRLSESYEGEVRHNHDSRVVVTFEVREDIVEQTYTSSQFIDGRLPAKGEALVAYIRLVTPPRKESEVAAEDTNVNDAPPRHRRRKGKLPRTF